MRMLVVVARRIASTHHVEGIRLGLFRPSGRYVAFALLGDDVGNISLLRLEVIPHGL